MRVIHPGVLVSFVGAAAASALQYGRPAYACVIAVAFAAGIFGRIGKGTRPVLGALLLACTAILFWQWTMMRGRASDAAYAAGFSHAHKEQGTFEGHIEEFPSYRFSDNQYVAVLDAGDARVLLSLAPHQKFSYLDAVALTGALQDVREQDRKWHSYYRKLGVHYTMYAPKAAAGQPNAEPGRFERLRLALFRFKMELRRLSVENLSSHASALVLGMLLGEKEELSKDEKGIFNAASLSHILVVSGYNISLIITFMFAVLKAAARPVRAAVSWLGIFLFVLLVGFDASVVRAALMGSVIMIAKITRRHSSALNVLFAVATGMLVHDPYAVLDAGFHLSFIATYALLVMPDFKRIPEALSTTCWVFLFVLPYVAYLSGGISLAGIASNVAVAFLLPVFMAVAGVSLLVSATGLRLMLDAVLLDVMSRYVFAVARLVQAFPVMQYEMPPHLLVAAYALAGGAVTFWTNRLSTAEFIERRYPRYAAQRPS